MPNEWWDSESSCSTLSFATMAAHQSGWARQRENAAAQCGSLCSAASTVSSLNMLLCDGRDSSVSSAATPAGASFSWERAQHSDSFGGKLNGLQSRAGQRSHPYGKAVLAARAISPPAVQGFDDMKSLHHHVPPSRETAAAQDDDELSVGPGNPDAFCGRVTLVKSSK